MISRNTSSVAFALALLLWVSAVHCASVEVKDVRHGSRGAESRNVRGGAEIDIAQRRIKPSLPERLQAALAAADLPQLDGRSVRVTRADAALFIENATAIPGRLSSNAWVREAAWSQWPDELAEVRHTSMLARRSYRVRIEGETDGVAWAVQTEQRAQRNESARDLQRALDAAVSAAVKKCIGWRLSSLSDFDFLGRCSLDSLMQARFGLVTLRVP